MILEERYNPFEHPQGTSGVYTLHIKRPVEANTYDYRLFCDVSPKLELRYIRSDLTAIGRLHLTIDGRGKKLVILKIEAHPLDCIWFVLGDKPYQADAEAQDWIKAEINRRFNWAIDDL